MKMKLNANEIKNNMKEITANLINACQITRDRIEKLVDINKQMGKQLNQFKL